jgi:hypothetical protein
VQKPNHQHTARVRRHLHLFLVLCSWNSTYYFLNFQQQLAQYDFQFSSWPVDFHWDESEDSLDRKKFEKIYDRSKASSSFIAKVLSLPGRIARYCNVDVNYFIYTIIIQAFFVDYFRYIVAHYFARPLMYPGSVKLLQNAMSKPCFFFNISSLLEMKNFKISTYICLSRSGS